MRDVGKAAAAAERGGHGPWRADLGAVSLGDAIARLVRSSATGTLSITERDGTAHAVRFARGYVVRVELGRGSDLIGERLVHDGYVSVRDLRASLRRALASRRRLGDVLVRDFGVSGPSVVATLRRQALSRLARLDALAQAELAFSPADATACDDEPLGHADFYRGRARARDRAPARPSRCARRGRSTPAHRTLGVEIDATPREIKRAYRHLARELHPDAHPFASANERAELARAFSELTDAYRELVA